MQFIDWGLIDYEVAFEKQKQLNLQAQQDKSKQAIIFCQHPSVVTYGRTTDADDYADWKEKKVEVDRGGKATYHGPNQLVVYPIIDIEKLTIRGIPPRNIKCYLNFLENLTIEVLGSLDIQGERISKVKNSETGEELLGTGVWVGSKKIASVGIAVKKWVTMHGLALNVEPLPSKLSLLRPCGFQAEQMTSVSDVLGRDVKVEEMKQLFVSAFKEKLI